MVINDNKKVVSAGLIENGLMTFLTFLNMLSVITTFVVKCQVTNIPSRQKCHNPIINNNYQNDKNVKYQKCQISK